MVGELASSGRVSSIVFSLGYRAPCDNGGHPPRRTTMGSMSKFITALAVLGACVALPSEAQDVKIESRSAQVGDLKMHYLTAGKGSPVILLHGYAQNSHMWRPAMK